MTEIDENPGGGAWLLRSADGTERELRLKPGRPLAVGRDLTSDISLTDTGVSRHHATICLESDGIWLEDLHSQNGTFVNAKRIQRTRLQPGDVIAFGKRNLHTLLPDAWNDGTNDPLSELSAEQLVPLLRTWRELGGLQHPAAILNRLLRAAVEAVQAARGVACLSTAGELEVVAGHPEEPDDPLTPAAETAAELALSSGRAQALRPPENRVSLAAAPLCGLGETHGVILLERDGGDAAFTPQELQHLAAFAWVGESQLRTFRTLGAASDLSSPSAWPQEARRQLVKPHEPRMSSMSRITASWALDPSSPIRESPTRLLALLERQIESVHKRIGETRPGETTTRDDIFLLCIATQAIRLQLSERPESWRGVRLRRLIQQCFEACGLPTGYWQLDDGEDVRVEAPLKVLTVVIELIAAACKRFVSSTRPLDVTLTGDTEVRVELRLTLPPALEPEAWSELHLPLALARGLTEQFLDGHLHSDCDAGRVALQVPKATGEPDAIDAMRALEPRRRPR